MFRLIANLTLFILKSDWTYGLSLNFSTLKESEFCCQFTKQTLYQLAVVTFISNILYFFACKIVRKGIIFFTCNFLCRYFSGSEGYTKHQYTFWHGKHAEFFEGSEDYDRKSEVSSIESCSRHFGSVILNEVQLRPWFRKSLDLQITLLVGYLEKTNALLVYSICFHETVHNNWCLHKSVRQTENGLERGFVKHWLNPV